MVLALMADRVSDGELLGSFGRGLVPVTAVIIAMVRIVRHAWPGPSRPAHPAHRGAPRRIAPSGGRDSPTPDRPHFQCDASQRETWLLKACDVSNTSSPNTPIPRVASSKSAGVYPECIALKRSHG